MAKLYFYYGTMNAGKSTHLLQSAYHYKELNHATMIFTPKIDDRYGVGRVTSRIGISADAELFDESTDFLKAVDYLEHTFLESIFIDEAQFLTASQIAALSKIAWGWCIPVMCYGLRTDFMGKLFEGSMHLLAIADKIEEIKSLCGCGAKATLTKRIDLEGNIITEGPQIEIGGNDKYKILCGGCFLNWPSFLNGD